RTHGFCKERHWGRATQVVARWLRQLRSTREASRNHESANCLDANRQREAGLGGSLTTRLSRQLCWVELLLPPWAATAAYAQSDTSLRLYTGDFNGDGKSDLLFYRNSDGLLRQYLLNGFQTSAAQPITSMGANWSLRAVGDVNGDGKSDLVFRRDSDGM